MSPSAQVEDPETGGVEVDLNDSRDTTETEVAMSSEIAVPEHDDWSESQGEDEVSLD